MARELGEWLRELAGADTKVIIKVVKAARSNLSRTAPSRDAFLEAMASQRLPKFVASLRRY